MLFISFRTQKRDRSHIEVVCLLAARSVYHARTQGAGVVRVLLQLLHASALWRIILSSSIIVIAMEHYGNNSQCAVDADSIERTNGAKRIITVMFYDDLQFKYYGD
jgi:hypothetical protein